MKLTRPVQMLGAVALAALCAAPALAYTGQDMAGGAKLSIDEAQEVALKAQPGVVTDKEFEKEPGGSGSRYSFDIKEGGAMHEVGIDAMTGALLENRTEGPNPD